MGLNSAFKELIKSLLFNNDSESISGPSIDIFVCIELNDKHSLKVNLKYSTKERVRFKHSLCILDLIETISNKIIFKHLNADRRNIYSRNYFRFCNTL